MLWEQYKVMPLLVLHVNITTRCTNNSYTNNRYRGGSYVRNAPVSITNKSPVEIRITNLITDRILSVSFFISDLLFTYLQ